MKTKSMNLLLVACLLVSGVVGCGPEVVALSVAATQIAPIVTAVGGSVLLMQAIENASLDKEKTTLEIEALRSADSPSP